MATRRIVFRETQHLLYRKKKRKKKRKRKRETLDREEREIVVPANRSVQSTLVITERDVTIPWEMDLAISGSFAVWFKKKWNGHWLWFFPVHNLERENKNFRRVGDKLLYTLKGSFTGVFGTSAHLYLKEFEYRKP